MPRVRVRALVDDEPVERALRRIRREVGLPDRPPDDALTEAKAASERGPQLPPGARDQPVDATDIELVTIDPAGARDLDQAIGIERLGRGFRVHYAIADVASFVSPGGPLDADVRTRGLTLYLPDERVPLHPPELSEAAASLLPGQDRAALLWQHDLDADGGLVRSTVRRALVRSREQLSYVEAQQRIDAGHHRVLQLLREVGQRRVEAELERGGVSLQTPVQSVAKVRTDDGPHYELTFETTLPVETWNAQISLLTGMAAAKIMLEGGVGVLRTLPRPEPESIEGLRRTAAALRIDWPDDLSYAERMSSLDMSLPESVALATQAARSMRSAGYLAFAGTPDRDHRHWAIAAEYAHVTAPLRRLVDRFAGEIAVAVCAGAEVPEWVEAALPDLPHLMDQARTREREIERAVLDVMECLVLYDRVGRRFDAIVTAIDDRGTQIVIDDPPVVTVIRGRAQLGSTIAVELVSVDIEHRRLDLRRVS